MSTNPQPVELNERVAIDPDGNLYFSYLIPEDHHDGLIYKCNNFNSFLNRTKSGSYTYVNVERYVL